LRSTGVAPASSEVWAASFLVVVFDVISFLFLRLAPPLGEASREVLGEAAS